MNSRADPEYLSLPVVFEDVGMAAFRIRNGIKKTECIYSEALSQETGCQLYFKHDHRQHTGSFKERGALNALLLLDEDQKKKGVIAASAGNHALGLAYHAQKLGILCTVVMPVTAPITKISKCRDYGATVHLYGENIGDSKEYALKIGQDKGQEYINGYDHPAIIAGAATMGLEIVEQVPDVDAVLVPIGGAGLIAGVSLAMKMLHPRVQVIGVEPVNCASFTKALQEGKPVPCDTKPTLADGLAVPTVGTNAFQVARKFVDKVVTVSERFIALAVLRMLEVEKAVVEGGGVIGLAPLLSGTLPELKGKKVVVCLCGGNIDITVLGRVIDRGLAADGRLLQFDAPISDRPGGLAEFCKTIAETGASVKDIHHERAFLVTDMMTINVRCVVETKNAKHAQDLLQHLINAGYLINMEQTSLQSLTKSQQIELQKQQQLLLKRGIHDNSSATVVVVDGKGETKAVVENGAKATSAPPSPAVSAPPSPAVSPPISVPAFVPASVLVTVPTSSTPITPIIQNIPANPSTPSSQNTQGSGLLPGQNAYGIFRKELGKN